LLPRLDPEETITLMMLFKSPLGVLFASHCAI